MNQQPFGKGNATTGQARRAVGANFAGSRDGDSSIFPTPIKQGDTRRRTSKKWGGPNPRTREENADFYDIILSHLLDEGYADTQEAAERIMVNMSEEWRESIVETRMDPRGRPASGPMNVYANPKGKPSQAHLDAVKSYEDEQRKKTPEQRKKELDDYRERQMNNK